MRRHLCLSVHTPPATPSLHPSPLYILSLAGSGLSSSAAIVVSSALAVLACHGIQLTKGEVCALEEEGACGSWFPSIPHCRLAGTPLAGAPRACNHPPGLLAAWLAGTPPPLFCWLPALPAGNSTAGACKRTRTHAAPMHIDISSLPLPSPPRSPLLPQVASFAAKAEQYVGVTAGGMDQAISVMGMPGVAMLVEFNPVRGGGLVCVWEGCVCVCGEGGMGATPTWSGVARGR